MRVKAFTERNHTEKRNSMVLYSVLNFDERMKGKEKEFYQHRKKKRKKKFLNGSIRDILLPTQ